MTPLEQLVTHGPGGPSVGPRATPVPDLVARLEAGATWGEVASATGASAAAIVAALAADALGVDAAPDLPTVRATPPRPDLLAALTEPALPGTGSRPARLALAAGLLQAFDFWDASHAAAQEADDLGEAGHAAYWHAIAHRREPDPGNASYWVRRVGRHPIHARLAEDAASILTGPDTPGAAARVVRNGAWDPAALIDLCTRFRPDSPEDRIARRLQRLEILVLLDTTATAAGITPG